MEKIAIITSGFLPVPASKGGAVENIVVNLLNENEKNNKMEFNIISIFDDISYNESKKYSKSKINFIKVNFLVKFLDKITFLIAKKVLKKENSQSYRYIFQRLYYLNKCSKILKKNDFDKVILENHPTQYLALKWRKNYLKYSGRYYYHCHNEFPGTYGCSEIIKSTKKIICVSKFIANSIANLMNMPSDKFIVLRNCIDVKRFSNELNFDEKRKLKEKYGIKDNEKILLFTGRITPEKGVKELVESLKNISNQNYKLLILGSALNELKTKTKYQEEIENIVQTISSKVIFTGFIKYEEINKFYSIADIAVLPSIWDDPAPLTVIESLVSGLPIITTNSGGIPEYATNGSAIIIERNKDLVENLSKSINLLLNDEAKLKEMSISAKKVSKDLTLNNYYNNFIDIMKKG